MMCCAMNRFLVLFSALSLLSDLSLIVSGFPTRITLQRRVPSLSKHFRPSTGSTSNNLQNKPLFTSTAEISIEAPRRILPTTRDLIKFGLPTLGIWLLQPILSLIDTSVVGICPGTTVVELAALGPGISWIDSSSYLFQFIGMATTNLYATAQIDKDPTKSDTVLSHALITSLFLGLFLFIMQYFLSTRVITMLSGAATDSIPHGILYSKIRAFAAPFALPTIVGQAAFMASKDAVTPFRAVLVGAVVNLLGDLLLVTVMGQGLAGAALATMISQVAGAVYLFGVVAQRLSKPAKDSTTSTTEATIQAQSMSSKLKLLQTAVKNRLHIPTLQESLKFLLYCGPLFLILLIKTMLWTFTTYACSTAGVINLAAHQMSQTYLPPFFREREFVKNQVVSGSSASLNADVARSKSNKSNKASQLFDAQSDKDAAKHIIYRVMRIGAVAGVANFLCCLLLPRSQYKAFTTSAEIAKSMTSASTLLALALLPHCFLCSMEGTIIAARDTKFHILFYSILGTLFVGLQSYVRSNKLGIAAVWAGTMLYQYVRTAVFSLRVRHLVMNDRLVSSASSPPAPPSSVAITGTAMK